MFKLYFIFFFSLVFCAASFAQFGSNKIGIGINAVYTTSTDIFLNPNSSNAEVRNRAYTLEDIWNPGLDIRYRFTEEFILGLNAEYIRKTSNAPNLTAFIGNQVLVFEVEDGFSVIPVELTAYYFFPFSTTDFKFLMGGGVGYYHGEFIRKFSDVELSVVQRKAAFGIHVSASMDYVFYENFSVRFEMKFRDPQYTVKSKYTKTELIYNGSTIQLSSDDFETKVDVNGLTFLLGLVISL